jgi:hypothetical protein
MAERKSGGPRSRKSGGAGGTRKRSPASGGGAKRSRSTASKARGSKSGASKPSRRKPPEPNVKERIEGLQGWMAEIERKQGRMTYFGAAAVLLAVAAAAASIVLAVDTRNNSASKDDLDALSAKVDGIQEQVKKATETELKGINETIGSLNQRIEDLKKKQAQDATDIAQIQSQTANAGSGKGGGGATPNKAGP